MLFATPGPIFKQIRLNTYVPEDRALAVKLGVAKGTKVSF